MHQKSRFGEYIRFWYLSHPCKDLESFVRGGPTLFFFVFFYEGGSKCQYKPAIIGPPAKRH